MEFIHVFHSHILLFISAIGSHKIASPKKKKSFVLFLIAALGLIHNLKNIEFQIIGFLCRPENRVTGCLMAIFHLTQAFMHILCRLPNGLGEQFIGHEMRAGAGCQKAAILQQLHGAQVDFAIALNRILDRASGLCKGRRIKNDYIEFSALCFESGQQRKPFSLAFSVA